jgi:putative sporulation protein YyaC
MPKGETDNSTPTIENIEEKGKNDLISVCEMQKRKTDNSISAIGDIEEKRKDDLISVCGMQKKETDNSISVIGDIEEKRKDDLISVDRMLKKETDNLREKDIPQKKDNLQRENIALPVVMCIGSERVSGDLLGPAVGRRLVEDYNLRAYVYGVTGRNINGANIDFYDRFIREVHKDSKVVAVDACLGARREIGKIKVGNCGVGAGHAVRKSGKRYGDVGVVGIVAENAEDNVMQLISVEVATVEELSGRIAEYLAENLERLVEN